MLDVTLDRGTRAWAGDALARHLDDRVPQGVALHARFLTLLSVRLMFETAAGDVAAAVFLMAGTVRALAASFTARSARPRCSRERTVPTAHPIATAASSVGHLLQIAEHDRFAIANGQRQDRLAQRVDALGSRQVPERVDFNHQHLVEAIVVLARVAVTERLKGPVPLDPPPHVVPGDAAQPRGDRRPGRVVAPGVAHDGQEHILRDVLGDRRRRRHVEREPVDPALTAAEELREGLGIAGRHAAHQLAVLKLV